MGWRVVVVCLVALFAVGCAWYSPQPVTVPPGPGLAVWWPTGSGAVSADSEVVLVFDRDMDRNAVGRSLRVSPPLPVVVVWDDDQRCRIVPGGGWPEGRVRIELADARDRDGTRLRVPFSLTFTVGDGTR